MILLAGAAFLFSPFFAVKNIRVENSERFATSDLCERIGLNQGDNAILFNRSKAEDILRQDPYIKDARLVWEFPDTMVISLTERKVRAYVPYMGSYLYIDEEGRVLDVQNVYTEGLPLVKGLGILRFPTRGSFAGGKPRIFAGDASDFPDDTEI